LLNLSKAGQTITAKVFQYNHLGAHCQATRNYNVTHGKRVGYRFAQFPLRLGVSFVQQSIRIDTHMPSSRKKAIIRKFSRDWIAGYLPPEDFVAGAAVELLGLDGKVLSLPVDGMKWICFVRDFNSGEPANPERLLRRTFSGRPRVEGLFVRLRLKDGEQIEGVAANDLSLAAGDGLFVTPPDTRSNTQRIWIPRSSLEELEVVAVIGATAKKKPPASVIPEGQESLF
jgi:hypothetical protein